MRFVSKENSEYRQMAFLPVSEVERKLTVAEAIRYLQTADPENAIKAIQ